MYDILTILDNREHFNDCGILIILSIQMIGYVSRCSSLRVDDDIYIWLNQYSDTRTVAHFPWLY